MSSFVLGRARSFSVVVHQALRGTCDALCGCVCRVVYDSVAAIEGARPCIPCGQIRRAMEQGRELPKVRHSSAAALRSQGGGS